jgi:hypothetical protein
MSEKWRAKRREQERKAGRWTDGTVRQDQMWAAFHWVVDSDFLMTSGGRFVKFGPW